MTDNLLLQPSISTAPEMPGTAVVKIIGLGGGGSNAINRMIELGLEGVDFIAANTDSQALASSLAPTRIQLGPRVTRGLGAGGDPKIGASAAMESSRELARALSGADMVFLTAGMGGGTGTGAAAVAAEIAREIGAVVIAIVTMPFGFEMSRRMRNASEGIRLLQPHTHTLITVPNDRLLKIVPRDLSLEVAFRLADDVLRQGVQGISELVTQAGLINVDFAHVREMMQRGGGALMAIGIGEGSRMAHSAVRQALRHPLLEVDSLDQASGLLVHFTGGDDLTLFEVGEAIEDLRKSFSPDVDLIFGATAQPGMAGRVQAILIVTGIGGRAVQTQQVEAQPEAQAEVAVVHAAQPQEQDLDIPAFLRRRTFMASPGG
jgi:cell division protein FtsZ